MFAGEMGQLLADPTFMWSLSLPDVPTKIYAGIGGPRGRFSPFGEEGNDGVLALRETELPAVLHQPVAALHTFIMNKQEVAQDIVRFTQSLVCSRKTHIRCLSSLGRSCAASARWRVKYPVMICYGQMEFMVLAGDHNLYHRGTLEACEGADLCA